MDTAYEQLANRLKRVHRHLRKWARRTGVTCYRLYEKDIPDQPLIVDWYDGAAVCWAYERTRNETPADEEAWLVNVTAAIRVGLDLPAENVFLKRRFRQQDRQEGDGQYHRLEQRTVMKVVEEHGLKFEVNLSDYVDTGLFLDHRPTRQRVGSESAGKRVLNLFAYTGAFTVHARAGGAAATTTVDLSNTYLEWATRNLTLNGFIVGGAHRLEKADCLQWLASAPARGERYDVIICDPPTFSNSKAMEQTFRIDHDHPWLLEQCAKLLAPGGTLYFSTNFRGFRLAETGLPALTITDISDASVPEDFRNRKIHQCWRMTRSGTLASP
jgi:23S rRNA (cytosine1962-C5)-methyltransferase